jgi:Protein of unknown function (DUF1631)
LTEHTGSWASGRPFPGHDSLYANAQSAASARLREIIGKAVAAADAYLYDICQQDQTTIGSPNIENLKLFRTGTQRIELQFSQSVNAAFDRFAQKNTDAEGPGSTLSLVDIDDMDDVVNAELITEALIRGFADALDVTGHRFCALFGFDKNERMRAPVTEKSLADFLRLALTGTELTPKVRATLFRCYESTLIAYVPLLLDEVNTPLVQAGVLPQLQSLRVARRQSDAGSGAGSRPAARAAGAVHPERIPSTSRSLDPAQHYGEYSSLPDMPIGAAENALFDEICNYLHTWRPQSDRAGFAASNAEGSAGMAGSATRRTLSKPEMISLLSSMQQAMPADMDKAMSASEASVSSMLKMEMLKGARSMGIADESVEIKREDEDALDLVGMLFDVMMTERDFRDEAKSLMSRLVVPYTKAAVLDRRLFLTKAHPARKLLNALTEAIEGNQGDGPQERELLNKAEGTVDKLVTEFNEDIAVFEMLETELRTFLDQHRRRIDLAEKRAKEAQRGQERLENARTSAARELDTRGHTEKLPQPIHEFFTRYWTHHLSMIALREGEQSPIWSASLHLADDILEILNNLTPDARFNALMLKRPNLESVLSSSGIMGEQAQTMVRKLAESASQYGKPAMASVPAPAIQESEAAGSVETASAVLSESSLRLVFNKQALDFNEDDVEFFKAMPIGNWLQLEGSNGGFAPIKLAWISPISSRLMFVNRRGVRVLVVSVEELAQMKKQGKLIVHAQDSVFEQTMDRVLNRLKTDFG